MNRFDEFKKKSAEIPPAEVVPEDGKEKRHVAIAVSETPIQDPEEAAMEMTAFYAQMNEVQADIRKIEAYAEQIGKLHSTSINSVNQDEKASCAHKLEQLVPALTSTSNKCRSTLKAMDIRTKELAPAAAKGSGSLRIRQENQRHLVLKFTEVMKRYKSSQEKYNAKYKQQLERQVKIVNPSVSKEEMQQILEHPEEFQQKIFDIGKRKVAAQDLQQMKDRFEEVEKIAKSIEELAQLFVEMEEMITAQGEMIDRIGHNMQSVEDYTANAKEDLGSAVKSQESIQRKKRWILLLALIGVLLVLMMIAYIFKHTGISSIIKRAAGT
jgi:t-SNARE complex subunit (syntaxin)